MEGVRGCWEFLWIGLKPSTWSEREYKSAGAVTLDTPLGFLGPNSIFAFDTSDHVRCLIWLAFLALLSGPLGLESHSLVPLVPYLKTCFQFWVQPFSGTCFSLEAWEMSWACLEDAPGDAMDQEEDVWVCISGH